MRLKKSTDYALRILIYLCQQPEGFTTVAEAASYHDISRNHALKLVNAMAAEGIITTQRGKSGGIMLNTPPSQIRLGNIIQALEDNSLLSCCHSNSGCRYMAHCKLESVLNSAQQHLNDYLNRFTLADLIVSASPAQTSTNRPPAESPMQSLSD